MLSTIHLYCKLIPLFTKLYKSEKLYRHKDNIEVTILLKKLRDIVGNKTQLLIIYI